MVFCFVAIIVFGILGIFSAKYRSYFRESLHCIKRTAMLKPCDTNFDQQMKAKITAGLMKRSERLGKIVYKQFNKIAWIFLIAMIISTFFTGLSIYNLAVYGNCNGPESTDICALNPEGTSGVGSATDLEPWLVTADDDPYIGTGNITIVEFGCHVCPYTKKAEPILKELLIKYEGQIRLVFRDFPVERHKLSKQAAEAAECADEQGKHWEYHDLLFERQKELSNETIVAIAKDIGLNITQFDECYNSGRYSAEVEKDFADGQAAGVYGTPTFFIGNITVVGPKPLADFEKAIKGQQIANENINACVE